MANNARRGNRTDDPAETNKRVLAAKNLLQLFRRFDSVLQGKDLSLWRQHWTHGCSGFGNLPGFDGKDYCIYCANIFGMIRHLGKLDAEVPFRGFHLQPVLANRLELLTASDQANPIAGASEDRGKIAANATGSENSKSWTVHFF